MMHMKRAKLNNEMVKPLKALVSNLLEQLEIAEKEAHELYESNKHFKKRFDEVSNELEKANEVIRIERGEKK